MRTLLKFLPKRVNKSLNIMHKRKFSTEIEREELETDVLIIGGGPSGLSTAIRLSELAKKNNKTIDITILEKGSEIGSHILSGNCFETKALTELIPNWKELDSPLETEVTEDRFVILLNDKSKIQIPHFLLPESINNHGNYIISLSQLCRWLGKYIETEYSNVNIFTGQAASQLVFDEESDSVVGAITNDFGIGKNGEMKESFVPGIKIKAKCIVMAEGCRGNLTENLKKKFELEGQSNQIYGLGLKEVWEIDTDKNENFKAGLVQHTVNWPLDSKTYGGSFMYHMKPNLIHIGLVIGLDYKNPYLNLYEEFQQFKTHPEIKKYLQHGKCIEYGARSINEGGYYSVPKTNFKGGIIVGCAGGLLNVSKVKGTHNAIRSGILAADSIFELFQKNDSLDYGLDYQNFTEKLRSSQIFKELWMDRNFKGAFKYGLHFGLLNGFIISMLKGKEFWKFIPKKIDSKTLEVKEKHVKKDYPKHDGVLTFDILDNVSRSGTNHNHDQPSHLRLKNTVSNRKSLEIYDGPEERFCPAKVYEFVEQNDQKVLQINFQNCLHCKCCSIKMVDEYIDWNVPEGGGGPKYNFM